MKFIVISTFFLLKVLSMSCSAHGSAVTGDILKLLKTTHVKHLALTKVTLEKGIKALQKECSDLDDVSFSFIIKLDSPEEVKGPSYSFILNNISVYDALKTIARHFGRDAFIEDYGVVIVPIKKR